MHQYRLSRLFIAVGISVAATSALASPQAFMSSRSFAMGGTGVAVAHPSSATSANPAMMAANHHSWSDDFGLALPSINARVADEEEAIDQVDDIQDVIDGLESGVSNFDPITDSPQSIQNDAATLRDRLKAFDDDTMRANIGLGLSFAVPGKSLAVGAFSNANLTVTVRGDVSDADTKALDDISTATSAADVETEVNKIKNGDGSLALTSKGKILASAVIEAGISFAHALELNNGDTLQLGFSPKYVQLQTFQYTESISGFEDDEFDGDEYQTEKSGFNLDIGAAYAFGDEKQWNAGIAVKNLIPMELDSAQSKIGEEKRTLKLNPMATVGIAHKSSYHVVTAELDLTKKEAFGFEDDTQWLAVGAEFDAWRYAQIRVGARYNLASNDDNDGIAEETQFTAGFGLNLFGARFDLGALISDADMGVALELGAAF